MAMHPRVSVSQICFMGQPLAEAAAHWRAIGPGHIGLISPPLLTDGIAPIQAVIAEGGYGIETIAHMFSMGQLSRDEAAWQKPRAELNAIIDMAAALGARSIYGLTGGRGAMPWEVAAECFRDMIAPCLARAGAAGVKLMIECATPLYAHGTISNNLHDTLTLAEIAGTGVCVDTFGCWTEAGLRDLIARAVGLGALIQVSDYVPGDTALPCRAVPGDGAIPLRDMLNWSLEAGYAGAFDIELLGPRIEAEGRFEATRRAAEKVSELLVSLGA